VEEIPLCAVSEGVIQDWFKESVIMHLSAVMCFK
jgi:hypothetical protein